MSGLSRCVIYASVFALGLVACSSRSTEQKVANDPEHHEPGVAYAAEARTTPAQQRTGTPGAANSTTTANPNQLPNPPPKFGGVIKTGMQGSKPWWPPRTVPPKGAPNVLLIMTDDQGYGVSGTFGGVIPTPTLDRLAKQGLRFTEFHSTALCSPSRAAIITGRNHHSVGFGVIAEQATGFPGYDSIIGVENATVGRILKDNGYNTSWFGKDHNTPTFTYSQSGPFDQWPLGMGFDYFYGFLGGETNQWTPFLFRNTEQIFPWRENPNYNMITGMADDAIDYLRRTTAAAPDKPFFLYYVPGGSHAPHQPTKEWRDKFKGKFDTGWNAMREQIFENQKKLGVIPANTKLTEWPTGQAEFGGAKLPTWDSLKPDEKKLFARQAETFAGYVAYTDYEIGRVVQEVENLGKLDNTLIIYISGDNGTSAEGTLNGTAFDIAALQGVPMPVADQLKFYDVWGQPQTTPHMAVPWAWAFDTPFKWTKQIASHFGGTRQGMVISWPGHINDPGGIRSQFHHLIDIVPTILEATGIEAPKMVDGIEQKPIEGVSMVYTFDKANANAKSTHTTQYFEMMANRAIYHDGWIATTTPVNGPWVPAKKVDPESYKWELYNIVDDYSQANDLAKQQPDKLRELQQLFLAEAQKYQVLPLDNDVVQRVLTPKPGYTAGRTEFAYAGALTGTPSDDAPNIIGRSYTITADVDVPNNAADGVVVTDGGRFGGYGLYLLKGKPVFTYNFLGLERSRWEGGALAPGKHRLVFDFKYDGPGFGKGGTGTLAVDGKQVASKAIPHTIPILMTIDETLDIGSDTRTPVDDRDYKVPFKFTGTVDKVAYKLGPPQLMPPGKAGAQARPAPAPKQP